MPAKISLKKTIVTKKVSLVKKKSSNTSSNSNTSSDDDRIAKTYRRLKLQQQILKTPGMYIGEAYQTNDDMYIMDDSKNQMVKKNIRFVPGLYKLADEGIVNMRDHQDRMRDKIDRQAKILSGARKRGLEVDEDIDLSRKYRPVKNIELTINVKENTLILKNDGDGIDVAMHPTENIWVPEMIFSELLTSTNYNENQEKTVGGKHGYGAKLIGLFSDVFVLETVDAFRKKKYVQTWSKNMTIRSDPVITSYRGTPYTQITFKPDLARFGIKSLEDDETVELIKKRMYDIAACTSKEVIVSYNGEKINTRTFERYVDLYIGTRGQCKRQYLKVNDRWEIVVCASDDGFEQVSFVNGICTYLGGRHVDHVATIISGRLAKYANDKKNGANGLTAKSIKDNMQIFVNSIIVNPDFDNQIKNKLNTPVSRFGSKCEISEDFLKKLSQSSMGILDRALKLSAFKSGKSLKKSDGRKTRRVKDPKLTDAEYAGSAKSKDCILILTEGDSAQTFATAGLGAFSEERRKYFGTYPLKGKCINPKDAKVNTIEKNKEFVAIKQALGLKQGVKYDTVASLRYGKVYILTDADVDGDHIKGLVFNLFHEFWPELLKIKGFFSSILTPIVKVIQNETPIKSFFSLPEFEKWKNNQGKTMTKWSQKYYKGLGTSDSDEAKECFRNYKLQEYSWDDIQRSVDRFKRKEEKRLAQEKVLKALDELKKVADEAEAASKSVVDELQSTYTDTSIATNLSAYQDYYSNQKKHLCDLAMELAFSKKNADYRKGWITDYLQDRSTGDIDHNIHDQSVLSYCDFINEKMIDFSVYDAERNIPSLLDGQKPGQRKILFSAFKRKLRKEAKVAQFSGYVSEHSGYHHGEESLNGTIVNMAQDYPGSNNINLFVPKGQFGSRVLNGKDHASARYIFTYLNPLTEIIFNPQDENVYEYLEEDGDPIEPKYYVPILPVILINGTRGIGTGWSSNIPNFNPTDIINNIKRYLKGEPLKEMTPWFRGFRGTVTKKSHQKYKVSGLYRRTGPTTVEITEIPIGSIRSSKSFRGYKNFLEELILDDSVKDAKVRVKQVLRDVSSDFTDKYCKFKIEFPSKEDLDKEFMDLNAFEKKFVLSHTISTSNMNLFNAEGVMTKYTNPEDILREYCNYRMVFYQKRKDYMINDLATEIDKISEKIRFITYVNDDSHPLRVRQRRKDQILAQLEEYNFKKFGKRHVKNLFGEDLEENKESYDYLLNMQIYSLTVERIEKLMKEKEKLEQQLEELKQTTTTQMWDSDLDQLCTKMVTFEKDWSKKYSDLLKLPKATNPVKLSKISLKPGKKIVIGNKK